MAMKKKNQKMSLSTRFFPHTRFAKDKKILFFKAHSLPASAVFSFQKRDRRKALKYDNDLCDERKVFFIQRTLKDFLFSFLLPSNLLGALTFLYLLSMLVRAKIPFFSPTPSWYTFKPFLPSIHLFSHLSHWLSAPKAHFSSNRYILILLRPCFSYRFLIQVSLWFWDPFHPKHTI